ncbi:tetratricopeptide repeat protein [Deinococcus sonorensis]|uniref:Tetratricopeptide repeat protein n=2 Tax=Deinococcus sonorensis TaxID=309891 RepID=A0AAU7UAU3_9DEIO
MRLQLFGVPLVWAGEQPLSLPVGKPLALLCYLAATAPRPATRSALSALLWEDQDPQHLRQALYTLRRAGVQLEGQAQLRYTGRSDLAELRAALDAGTCTPEQLEPPFLEGLERVAAPGFLGWLEEQRQHWAGRQRALLARQFGHAEPEPRETGAVPVLPDRWLGWALSVWGEPDPEALSHLLYGDARSALEVASRLALVPAEALKEPVPEVAGVLLHARAARLLQGKGAAPERIAQHFLRAQDGASAVPHLLASARAMLGTQPQQARAQALRALWASDSAAHRLEALFVLEQHAEQTRQDVWQQLWLSELEQLAFQTQDDDVLLRLALVQAQRRQRAGRPEAAAEAARTALDIARRLGRMESAQEAQLLLGAYALGAGRLDEAAHRLRPLLRASAPLVQLRARLNLGTVYALQGRRVQSVEHHERALTLARQLGHRPATAAALNNLAGSYEQLARYADAARMAREAYQLAALQQDRAVQITALLNLAEFHRYAGAYGPCWNTVQEALDLVGPDTPAELHSALLARLGLLELRFGRRAAARSLLDEALQLARQAGTPRPQLIAQMQLALLRLPSAAARQELEQVGERFRTHGYGLLADLTELHAVHQDPEATPERLLAVARQHRQHAHPHLAWLAAVQQLRATGEGRAAVRRGLQRFQFAEAPEVLAWLGERPQARALRLEQASGLPPRQRRAFLETPLESVSSSVSGAAFASV